MKEQEKLWKEEKSLRKDLKKIEKKKEEMLIKQRKKDEPNANTKAVISVLMDIRTELSHIHDDLSDLNRLYRSQEEGINSYIHKDMTEGM